MRHFTIGPPLVVRGRKFKGIRGYAGKPFHPPLTDFPIVSYVLGALFDVLSWLLYGGHEKLAGELFHAATWVFLAGAAVSVLAAITGWADWASSSEPGTQARRTINTHAIIMITVTVLTLINLALRLTTWLDRESTPLSLAILSVIIAVLVSTGAAYGGSMVYDYGFNVETAGDSPVWHQSERDVYPGQKSEPEAISDRV
jgi:uncharacterized membrane protein